jgi:hypothetical protein
MVEALSCCVRVGNDFAVGRGVLRAVAVSRFSISSWTNRAFSHEISSSIDRTGGGATSSKLFRAGDPKPFLNSTLVECT